MKHPVHLNQSFQPPVHESSYEETKRLARETKGTRINCDPAVRTSKEWSGCGFEVSRDVMAPAGTHVQQVKLRYRVARLFHPVRAEEKFHRKTICLLGLDARSRRQRSMKNLLTND